MNRFDDAMSRLAAELSEARAPRAIERSVLAEFDLVKRRKRGKVWVAAAGAIAASIAVVWFIQHKPVQQPSVAAPPAAIELDQPFVPIPYVLPPGPYERVEVVRMKLPVSELIAAGYRLQTSDLGAQAEADVMVGQDGRPRAIRLISISSFN
ncbi:MAG TPA: hypothetical protein VGG72_12615 [Bryobacteraceae bacterium]|jgi:hypothetical protein